LSNQFGEMVHLKADGKHAHVYQKVQEYLAQHFTRLPKVDIYYDAEGKIPNQNRRDQLVVGLICVQIHADGYGDTIGLLLEDDCVDLDAVCTGCIPELKKLYGYHE